MSSVLDPDLVGGTRFVPDPPFLPVSTPMQDDHGAINPLWRQYHVAAQDATHSLQSKGSDHLLASHARRLSFDAGSVPAGTLLIEIDRNSLLYTAGKIVDRWAYVSGVMVANIHTVPTDVGPDDDGLLLWLSDSGHLMRWTGTTWQFGPGDAGNGYYATFGVAAQAQAGWWAQCNGTAANYVIVNGNQISLARFVMPNVGGQYFRL